MKNLSLKLVLGFIFSSLILVSCNDDDNKAVNKESISAEEASAVIEVDDISNDVNNVIDDFFEFEEGLSSRSETNKPDFFNCMTASFEVSGTTKTITLDFGESCSLPSDNVLSGKIIMSYELNTEAQEITVTYTYQNFYFNENGIDGQSTIVRVKENENGNPQSTLTYDVAVTWSDGEYASGTGTKIREWVEGFDTRTWEDNVHLITGSWSVTLNDETTYKATIIEPLRREMICKYIVSGSLELQKNNVKGTLDFGDGTCDDIAIFTNESGEESEVTLR
ncbi:hypothetical protein [Lutibacter sp. B1]|uniref:hypothetical protein n=1 Tax=Lutibacter sp. B1 TaxID=2725996 RepID=UPI001456D9D2|nr:hypothetical protein [Lutibacter sp. B1]NLP57351.1 hypothetical protein [Lutibacter sp. B1]